MFDLIDIKSSPRRRRSSEWEAKQLAARSLGGMIRAGVDCISNPGGITASRESLDRIKYRRTKRRQLDSRFQKAITNIAQKTVSLLEPTEVKGGLREACKYTDDRGVRRKKLVSELREKQVVDVKKLQGENLKKIGIVISLLTNKQKLNRKSHVVTREPYVRADV